MGRDEVLKNRQSLTEGTLDRPRDHLTTWIGNESLHTRDLSDLLTVTSSSGVHHHVEWIESDVRQVTLHRTSDVGVRRGPDLNLLLAALIVGDDPSLELSLSLLCFLLVAIEDLRLFWRSLDVVDRDGKTRLRRVAEAECLDLVKALLDHCPGILCSNLFDNRSDGQRLLPNENVDKPEVLWKRCVEDDTPGRRLDLLEQWPSVISHADLASVVDLGVQP